MRALAPLLRLLRRLHAGSSPGKARSSRPGGPESPGRRHPRVGRGGPLRALADLPEARNGPSVGGRRGVPLLPDEALCPACSEWWRLEALVRHLLAAHPSSAEAARIRAWLGEDVP